MKSALVNHKTKEKETTESRQHLKLNENFNEYYVPNIFTDSQGDEKVRDIWRSCCPTSASKPESAKICYSEVDLIGFWISERICGDAMASLSPVLFQCLTTLTVGSVCLCLQAIECFQKEISLVSFSPCVASLDKHKLSYWKIQWAVISYCPLMILIFQTFPHHIPKINSFPPTLLNCSSRENIL